LAATVTSQCSPDGTIGTLVTTPTGSKDSGVAFRVVLGVDRDATECNAENHYDGCIVQRRELSYIPHTPFDLPIKMHRDCLNVPCGVHETCAANGKCVPARIDPASCVDGPCYPPGDGDSSSSVDGGGKDGDTYDAAQSSGQPLFCPPEQHACSATPCCWSRSGGTGACRGTCDDATEVTLHCNQKSDCKADAYCCADLGSTDGWFTRVADAGIDLPDAIVGGDDSSSFDSPVDVLTDAKSDGPTDSGGSNDGGGGLGIHSTQCASYPNVCGAWICRVDADCPPAVPVCDKTTSPLAGGVFGRCR
jgi:hypothetical protein